MFRRSRNSRPAEYRLAATSAGLVCSSLASARWFQNARFGTRHGSARCCLMSKPKLKKQREKFRRPLPDWMAKSLRSLAQSSAWLRWPAALVLIMAGVFGFLPILGFWMVPLGFVLIVQDIPPLREPLTRLFAYIDRKWPA